MACLHPCTQLTESASHTCNQVFEDESAGKVRLPLASLGAKRPIYLGKSVEGVLRHRKVASSYGSSFHQHTLLVPAAVPVLYHSTADCFRCVPLHSNDEQFLPVRTNVTIRPPDYRHSLYRYGLHPNPAG